MDFIPVKHGKAKRVWLEDKSGRFVRIYSVEAFKERVAKYKDKLNSEIFYFTNEKEMKMRPEDQLYVKFAACFTKEQ